MLGYIGFWIGPSCIGLFSWIRVILRLFSWVRVFGRIYIFKQTFSQLHTTFLGNLIKSRSSKFNKLNTWWYTKFCQGLQIPQWIFIFRVVRNQNWLKENPLTHIWSTYSINYKFFVNGMKTFNNKNFSSGYIFSNEMFWSDDYNIIKKNFTLKLTNKIQNKYHIISLTIYVKPQ